MSPRYYDNIKWPKPKESQPGTLGISSREFAYFAENSAESLGSWRKRC